MYSFLVGVILSCIGFLQATCIEQQGTMYQGDRAVCISTAHLCTDERSMPVDGVQVHRPLSRRQVDLPQNDASSVQASYPDTRFLYHADVRSPQTLSGAFVGATYAQSGFFPPDSMGAVGPTQYIVAINGRIKSYNKTSFAADGSINTTTDSFFDAVLGGSDFTSDPRIRYDRLSGRWFIIMISVPPTETNNKILIAVSDGATISNTTTWSLYTIPAGSGNFWDYPTLGIDANALYIGGAMFSNTLNSRVAVVRKSSLLSGGPIVYTLFDNLQNNNGVGPYVPQGVDNMYDASPTYGYFIDVDNASFGTLVLRRISNAGGTPTISSNLLVTVPTTSYPIKVPHKGNLRGRAGNLDALDDRLFAAQIRNNKLWTAHNISVNNKGIAGTASPTRNGCRWYQLDVSGVPALVQSGTLYMPTALNATSYRSYWIPSVAVSGQGHMALGCSAAGINERINAVTVGRLATDALGTLGLPVLYTASSTAYNPSGDTGDFSDGRRWGDFSFTCVDPCDDMTLWTIQEYCNAANSWACAVAKLKAPPPANITSVSSNSVAHGQASVIVTVTGTSVAGSGFFDPGAGFSCRLAAQVTGGVSVTSVTYVNPTSVQLQLNTTAATTGLKNITITNPDGQSVTGVGVLNVT